MKDKIEPVTSTITDLGNRLHWKLVLYLIAYSNLKKGLDLFQTSCSAKVLPAILK